MKWIFVFMAFNCSLLSLSAQTGRMESEQVNKTIDSLNKVMEKVFNADDMAATAAFYSDDAEIAASNYLVKGRKNLNDYWMNLKGLGRGWKLEVIETGGTGDFIYQLGKSDLTYLARGKETKSVTNFVLIWKKQSDGTYKIFRDYLTNTEFKKP